MFEELTYIKERTTVKYCRIFYGEHQILRPIKNEDLREYLCKNNFKYAVGFHSFYSNSISIDKSNEFSGIRIYMDNMLLCDENELLQNLDNFGLLEHTLNGQLQSVKGIGAVIYITDKVNITANARRTFIEVMDTTSIEFLKIIAEFVNTIYDARYALSNYFSAIRKHKTDEEKLAALRQKAVDKLTELAKEEIELPSETEDDAPPMNTLSVDEQKRVIKKKIESCLDQDLKQYLTEMSNFDVEGAYSKFLKWLNNKNNL